MSRPCRSTVEPLKENRREAPSDFSDDLDGRGRDIKSDEASAPEAVLADGNCDVSFAKLLLLLWLKLLFRRSANPPHVLGCGAIALPEINPLVMHTSHNAHALRLGFETWMFKKTSHEMRGIIRPHIQPR